MAVAILIGAVVLLLWRERHWRNRERDLAEQLHELNKRHEAATSRLATAMNNQKDKGE